MKLPNIEKVIVPEAKITEYLLSFAHRDGCAKAVFFTGFGFTTQAWQTLADALISHAQENEVAKMEATSFGVRYVIEGILTAPDGRSPNVRVVWFIATKDLVPYLVTAYPL
ncbi:MAG: hypothetical protein M3X11_14280 [Acidobacteriota bacterium]|nr:hypothetical protein [Acidobacteriota bacterium]